MGKKRRLNKFISKWIKSDLPEDHTTVLLLGVTRIPTSPPPVRRPCSLPIAPNDPPSPPSNTAQARRLSFSTNRRTIVRRNSSKRRDKVTLERGSSGGGAECTESGGSSVSVTPSNYISNDNSCNPMMERSVDSIGTCSLDVDASADLSSDWSEASSVGTLRSASILTPPPEPHLPSYLSLACTVNGYSTTTNYDPIRLARSRDASPHRIETTDHLTPKNLNTYSVQNNLLSPPNLVPLPTKRTGATAMEENTYKFIEELYNSTILTKEPLIHSNLFTKSSLDSCLEKTHHNIQTTKSVSFEKTVSTTVNGQSKCTTESSVRQEFSNGIEKKSFIQQRVERLYGPGALAQGFFVTKRQKDRTSESENYKPNNSNSFSKYSKTFLDDSNGNEENVEPNMKQSTSSPTLPVLRHLRPEFRAQLPIISPRKGVETTLQKSSTVPELKEDVKVNGHSKVDSIKVADSNDTPVKNVIPVVIEESGGEKNGHYFLKILDKQAKRLLSMADKTEKELELPDLSEDVIGKVRSAAGKARLLVSQKMQQFKGLCTNNINQNASEAFPTTNDDLQGFWDMVMLQVDQVDALFKEIDVIKNNGWKEVRNDDVVDAKINGSMKARKTVNRPKPPVLNEAKKAEREAQRKQMIEARRKAMKAAAQQNKPREGIEIFVPESS